MGRLTPAEHDRDLDLRPLVEEANDVPLLRLVVVHADLRPQLYLLDVNLLLVLASQLRLLLLRVAVLAVIHHPADGRIGARGDLDQVEILGVGILSRLVGGLDSDLRAVRVDQTDARSADTVVDSSMRNRRASWLI